MKYILLSDLFCMGAINMHAQVFLKDTTGKWGLIDESGNVVFKGKYDDVQQFSEGLAAVCLNEKWGFIDKKGKEVIPLKYTYAYSFKDGVAKVELNDRLVYINKYGRQLK